MSCSEDLLHFLGEKDAERVFRQGGQKQVVISELAARSRCTAFSLFSFRL